MAVGSLVEGDGGGGGVRRGSEGEEVERGKEVERGGRKKEEVVKRGEGEEQEGEGKRKQKEGVERGEEV